MNQCALPVDWPVIAELLGGGIDSRKEIDLWLLQYLHNEINVHRERRNKK